MIIASCFEKGFGKFAKINIFIGLGKHVSQTKVNGCYIFESDYCYAIHNTHNWAWSGVGVAKSGGAKGSSVAGLLVVFGNDGVDTLIQLINRGGLQLLINFLKTFVLHLICNSMARLFKPSHSRNREGPTLFILRIFCPTFLSSTGPTDSRLTSMMHSTVCFRGSS